MGVAPGYTSLHTHLWKGEKWSECTGPDLGEKQNCTGACSVTLSPSGGSAATVWLLNEHFSTKPPSEPTRKESESHEERAREVTPTLVPPAAWKMKSSLKVTRNESTDLLTQIWLCDDKCDYDFMMWLNRCEHIDVIMYIWLYRCGYKNWLCRCDYIGVMWLHVCDYRRHGNIDAFM